LRAVPSTLPLHASTHQNGGTDEISVTGLSGLLADGQTALAHASTHQNGGADEISVAGLSGLLADGQTALAHASTHASAGSDPLTLAQSQVTSLSTDLAAKLAIAGGTMTGQLNFSGTTHAGIKLLSLTTVQRDALTAANGMLIYNTTTATVQKREAGAWVDSGGGGLTNWTASGGTHSGQEFAKFVPSSATANVSAIIEPKGQGAFQLNESDGAAGGNNRGAHAIDLQASRDLATQVASGAKSFAAGTNNTASGDFSSCIGVSNEATTRNTLATGYSSRADKYGQRSHASSQFSAVGDSQMSDFVLSRETVDATQRELFLDGSAATERVVLSNNASYAFWILLIARRTDADGENDAWEFKGLIHRDANAASTTLDALQSNQIGATAWSVDVDADTGNGSLRIRCTGENAKTVRWVATIHTSEVTE